MARILIAEDDAKIASFLQKGLQANGWATVHVEDGAEAEQLALGGGFDLLILDIGLPSRGGFEVLQGCARGGTGCRYSCSPAGPRCTTWSPAWTPARTTT
ncbi:response regulator transcription factor [Phytohabitans flavus]|uniref:response regulator transcription factor n=1 Tax=Phytohabitans flavus TaxID=1076124 RepID=UPI00363B09C6